MLSHREEEREKFSAQSMFYVSFMMQTNVKAIWLHSLSNWENVFKSSRTKRKRQKLLRDLVNGFYGNTHISAERFHGTCLSTPKATFCVIALCYIPEVDTGRILPIFWQGILKRDFSEIQMFGFIRCIFSSLNLVWKHRAMKHACEYNHALLQLLGIQSVHWSCLLPNR